MEPPTRFHSLGQRKPGRKKSEMELSVRINEIDLKSRKVNEEKDRLDRAKVKEEIKKDEEKEERKDEVRSLYKQQFHPVEYMRQYYAEIDPEEGFFLTHLHQFFQDKQQTSTKNPDEAPRIVLEVGSGPLISGAPGCWNYLYQCIIIPPP